MRAQEKPEVLDWARSRSTDIESITAAEVSALAKTYLPKARASRVTILPAKPETPDAAVENSTPGARSEAKEP